MRWVASQDHARHDPAVELEASQFQSPFEHAGRIEAIISALENLEGCERLDVTRAPTTAITAVHDPGLVEFLEAAWSRYQHEIGPRREIVPDVFAVADLRRGMDPGRAPVSVAAGLGWWGFETTTPIVEGTYVAARSAVDVAISATMAVLDGERAVFGACRPPGHHATTSRYGGYCFFNNAAIAAQWARDAGAARVSILDVDYHHGNGTQQIFYERGDVQYVSLHADPVRAFPYHLGFADEIGAGKGRHTTHNVVLPEGVDDDTYLAYLEAGLDVVDTFGPDVVIVSLGFDTLDTDPLGDFRVSLEGLGACGAAVAERGHPSVVLAEGGYDVTRLGDAAVGWLTGFDSMS